MSEQQTAIENCMLAILQEPSTMYEIARIINDESDKAVALMPLYRVLKKLIDEGRVVETRSTVPLAWQAVAAKERSGE